MCRKILSEEGVHLEVAAACLETEQRTSVLRHSLETGLFSWSWLSNTLYFVLVLF